MFVSDLECLNYMDEAILNPIRLDCGFNVQKVRRKFYLARRRSRAQGDFSFDSLKFRVEGPVLTITNPNMTEDRRRYREELEQMISRKYVDAGKSEPQ